MKIKGISILITIALLLSLMACEIQHEKILKLGTNVWPGYEPLYMARDKGLLDQEKVHLVEYSTNAQVLQSYRNGLIDAAALTLDEAMLLLETGERPKIVIVTDISDGADVIIGQSEITQLKDIEGKRVGVEANALGAYMITRALELANLKKDAITVVQTSIDEHEHAFKNKLIDAVVTFEPVRSKILASGGKQLFDSSMIPGEIVDVIVVRDSYLKDNEQTVKHLQNVWFLTTKEIAEKPQESAMLLGRRMNLDIEQTLKAYEGLKLPNRIENQRLLDPSSSDSLHLTANKMCNLMLEKKLLRKNIDPRLLFTN